MSSSEWVSVGNNPYAPYVAFGDDSKYKDTLTYAFVVVSREDAETVRGKFRKIKAEFGIPSNVQVHCRVFFNSYQRNKLGLTNFTPIKFKRFIAKVIDRMNRKKCLVRYAWATIPDNGVLFEPVEDVIQNSEKGMLGMLAMSCFFPPPRGQVPLASDCEIFVSEDTTKIRFLGKGKKRADKYTSGFSAVGSHFSGAVRVEPKVLKNQDDDLLQLADIYAYVCSHALSKHCKDDFFWYQLSKVKYFTRSGPADIPITRQADT